MLLKDSKGKVIHTIPLTVCGGTFVTKDYNFPPGEYTYAIDGVDTGGVPFNFEKKEKLSLKSDPSLYEVTVDTSSSNVEVGKEFKVVYTVKNKGLYCTSFDVKVPKLAGFDIKVLPSDVTKKPLILKAQKSASITLVCTPTSSATPGKHEIPMIVSNKCSTMTPKKPVQLKVRVTPLLIGPFEKRTIFLNKFYSPNFMIDTG